MYPEKRRSLPLRIILSIWAKKPLSLPASMKPKRFETVTSTMTLEGEELNEKTHVDCLADSVLHFLGEMCNSIVDILFKIFESVHRVDVTN